ncbi:MAG: UDP-N-acetyl-D-mannosamine dehydrogenase, partial [Beijerinckiaceae bacterium]
ATPAPGHSGKEPKPFRLSLAPVDTTSADVCIVGLGYVGLPLAAILADKGLRIAGCDIRKDVVEAVNDGRITIVEPYLDALVAKGARSGLLRAHLSPQPADAFIIAVPTPTDAQHKADLSYVFGAIRSIAPVLKRGDLVVIESTSPVGTTDQAAEILAGLRPDLTFPQQAADKSDILMAYCPERVLPGAAIRELTENARTLGGLDRRSGEGAHKLYARFVSGKLAVTSARAAELSKLVENSFRDVNIAFANELSMLCDRIGVDVREVIATANLHPRVNILSPGAGVGGHCIPVDPWFIHEMAPDITPLIRTAREVNDSKPHFVAAKIRTAVSDDRKAKIVLLGLSYKPDVDDMRESPSVEIAHALAEAGFANLHIVEPHVSELPKTLRGLGLHHHTALEPALAGAAAVAILTPHKIFAGVGRSSLPDSVSLIDPAGIAG